MAISGPFGTVFKRNGDWIEPTLQYTAQDLFGTSAKDDDPGRIRPGKDVTDASFYSFLEYSSAWSTLNSGEKEKFKTALPFRRSDGSVPGVSGYLENDRVYSAGGWAINRSSVRGYSWTTTPTIDDLFERRVIYPDFEPQERLARLVGLDEHKSRLTKMLGLLVNPAGLETWAQRHHPKAGGLIQTVMRRPPLVILAGDVGSGKSELAETIGDAVARQEGIEITLFPLSLSTRGEGRVR